MVANFTFTSCQTNAKEISLSYYSLITGRRTDGFMPFPRALAQSEMQTASSRIWTWVAYTISYNDNYYTKLTHCGIMITKLNLKIIASEFDSH